MRRFEETVAPGTTNVILQSSTDHYALNEYDCPGGGSACSPRRIESSSEFENSNLEFIACQWEGFRYDGVVSEFTTDFGNFRHRF